MPSAELIERHAAAMDGVETLATRDLVATWREIDPADAEPATRALRAAGRDLAAAYGEIAAVAAADFYDEARAEARPPGRFRAEAAGVAPLAQVDAMVRWAVAPMWSANPRAEVALTRLSGGLQRLIRQGERQTIFRSGRRDTALATWARQPRSDACAFCLMLGSRSDLYATGRTASAVGAGGRIRGTRPAGESYHDHCRCTTVPVWTPDDTPQVNRLLADEWEQATAGEREQLAAWRRHVDETRPRQHVTRT